MNKIASFTVNHDRIAEGIYISRIDGDITTYDMRMRKPNMGDYIDNLTIHSLEHMFATYVRNSEIGSKVIYFGPMGCQTGFYLLVRDESDSKVLEIVNPEPNDRQQLLRRACRSCGCLLQWQSAGTRGDFPSR